MIESVVAQGAVRPLLIACVALLLGGCGADERASVSPMDTPEDRAPRFVGSAACADCHTDEFEAWQTSHHALAMQHATAETVLGDFSGVSFDYFGVTSTFFQRDGTYYVRTDDEEGELRDFPVAYVFGVMPLQQYLVEFPGGRLQPLALSWDSRPAEDGGQRWFHLYPDEPVTHADTLHWTGREQNWNYMCAECHSTKLEKNYDAVTDSYETTWSDINVGCEGCHGPGSRHVTQAESDTFGMRSGLLTDLDDAGRAVWEMNPATGIAARSELRLRPPAQPEACGRCHARRSVAATDYVYDRPLMDTHVPSLLDDRLYYADGQILEEVYVYGSFVQSRMYQAGVSCSDCHEPHAAALRTAGEPSNICSTCHLPARFDSTEHHRHPADSVSCVDCHMTSRDYMIVDGRRDHSFRIPRPDLSLATGSPNACNQCHADRDTEWALNAYREWFGDDAPAHYGLALHAGRTGGGNAALLDAIGNTEFPGIARGTALTLLRPPYSEEVARTIQVALGSGDPFVRLGALRALSGLQQELQVDWATPLLGDRIRAIRIEAARAIAPFRSLLNVRYDAAFRDAERELLDSLEAIAERPEAQAGIGNLHVAGGDPGRAESAFRQALSIAPYDPVARVNLADLFRAMGRDADAEAVLREGMAEYPEEPTYRHSLGLLLVRQQQPEEGLTELQAAASLQPDNARFVYVYGVALNSLGRADEAVATLTAAKERFPGDFDIHWALATILRDQGRTDEARAVALELQSVYPGIPPLQELLRSL